MNGVESVHIYLKHPGFVIVMWKTTNVLPLAELTENTFI